MPQLNEPKDKSTRRKTSGERKMPKVRLSSWPQRRLGSVRRYWRCGSTTQRKNQTCGSRLTTRSGTILMASKDVPRV